MSILVPPIAIREIEREQKRRFQEELNTKGIPGMIFDLQQRVADLEELLTQEREDGK